MGNNIILVTLPILLCTVVAYNPDTTIYGGGFEKVHAANIWSISVPDYEIQVFPQGIVENGVAYEVPRYGEYDNVHVVSTRTNFMDIDNIYLVSTSVTYERGSKTLEVPGLVFTAKNDVLGLILSPISLLLVRDNGRCRLYRFQKYFVKGPPDLAFEDQDCISYGYLPAKVSGSLKNRLMSAIKLIDAPMLISKTARDRMDAKTIKGMYHGLNILLTTQEMGEKDQVILEGLHESTSSMFSWLHPFRDIGKVVGDAFGSIVNTFEELFADVIGVAKLLMAALKEPGLTLRQLIIWLVRTDAEIFFWVVRQLSNLILKILITALNIPDFEYFIGTAIVMIWVYIQHPNMHPYVVLLIGGIVLALSISFGMDLEERTGFAHTTTIG